MKLLLRRLIDTGKSTVGMLFIDGKFFCFCLEDTHRDTKVYGHTRISAGTYEIRYRKEGGKHKHYSKKFSWHKGMLHLLNVPNFRYIYIHIGNTADDTLGCILVGTDMGKNHISHSTQAYQELCEKVYPALDRGEHVEITILDEVKK
jgi:hypothetical protein